MGGREEKERKGEQTRLGAKGSSDFNDAHIDEGGVEERRENDTEREIQYGERNEGFTGLVDLSD